MPDTVKNRDDLQRFADLITAEIRADRFTAERYLHFFPNGNHAHEFRPAVPEPAKPPKMPTLREYFDDTWIKRQQPPIVRAALTRDYRQHITRYLLPLGIDGANGRCAFGELLLTEVTAPILLPVRDKLLARGLALKTVRNIMDASFRAMVRDARTVDQLIDRDPFTGVIWPRLPKRPADPFTEEERDKILRWFRKSDRFYYPFVFFLFHTGLRPSEAVALR